MKWTLTKENAEKVIARLSATRKVDEHIARTIFRSFYENKPAAVLSLSTLCSKYAADLWNMGAVLE